MKKKLDLCFPWGITPWMKKTLMYMKLTCLIFLLGIVHVFAVDSYAQSTNLSVKLKNATVESALQSIEDQSEFYFLYSRSMIDVNRKVNIQLSDVKIDDLLKELFDGTTVDFIKESKFTEGNIANNIHVESINMQLFIFL